MNGADRMKERMKTALQRLKDTFKKHGWRMISVCVVFLTGVFGFEIGFLEGQRRQSGPLFIEVPAKPMQKAFTENRNDFVRNDKDIPFSETAKTSTPAVNETSCAFVGSKNSNKYHIPTCSFAKRIKPENKVCFATEEDAKTKGYQPGCLK